ncbi:MAG: replicative DNA helicase [Elusimicrobia bacterium CG_4_9_14_3_um_filter_62_55]|nr:MAG: replicative DNA helicase [Elusimicrobia bacterium CG_4_9_14_3_um_filter_62_55]
MPEPLTHIPPQSLEAEKSALGSMLIEAEAAEHALENLTPEDFYASQNRLVFTAAEALSKKGTAIDVVTVSVELKRINKYGDAGGATYLKELCASVATATHIEHYTQAVKNMSVLRRLIKEASGIVSDCMLRNKETSDILDKAQARILAVANERGESGFRSISPITHETLDKLEKLSKSKGEVTGVSSGIKGIDKMTSGFQNGDLIILAARPSQGKTALALNFVSHMAMRADPPVSVGFFSLEMGADQLATRMISADSGTDQQMLRSGYFPRSKWTDITNAASRLAAAPLHIDDTAGLSILEVRGRARRLDRDLRAKGKKLGVILIDYLQLMRGSGGRQENRQQEVSEISRGLKQMARDLGVPVIALSQLSRRVEDSGRTDKRPILSDLRESGALEQDADVVAFIFRESYYKRDDPTLENKAEVIIAKQRNGPIGKVELIFRRELTRFEDAYQGEEPDDGGEQADIAW